MLTDPEHSPQPQQVLVIRESPNFIRGANAIGFETPEVVGNLLYYRRLYGDRIASRIVDLLKPSEGDTLADLGCGPAVIAAYMYPYIGSSGELICLDASLNMLQAAIDVLTPAGNIQLIHGDIHHASSLIAPQSVDKVILSGNVHLLTNKLLAFSEVRKIMRSDGRLVIVTHLKRRWHDGSRELFSRMIQKAEDNTPYLFPEGLRMPTLTEIELDDLLRIINSAGFQVSQYEPDTYPGNSKDVLGRSPSNSIELRLRALRPNASEDEVKYWTHRISEDFWDGNTTRLYLVCTPIPV